jgi:hypothetical protein
MEKVHTYDADASDKYVCPNKGRCRGATSHIRHLQYYLLGSQLTVIVDM